MISLFKFRLGSVHLKCYDHSILDRAARVCLLCSTNTIEDEKHVLFECEKYEGLRRDHRWADLYRAGGQDDIKGFMGQKDQRKLCSYVHNLLHYRACCLKANLPSETSRVVVQRLPQADMFDSSDDSSSVDC